MGSYPALDVRFAPGPGAGALQDFLYAELDAFEPVAIQEHDSGEGWRVFFRSAHDRDVARGALHSEFGAALLDLSPVDIPDEDWARRSQADLRAVRAGRIVVAPPWDVPAPRAAGSSSQDDIVIVIEPSMGFGTGHHATTRLCLELLQECDLSGATAIDVGTGSGILAIAAWTLGAAQVVAVDNDPDALQNARENVERNGGRDAIVFVEADLGSLSLPPAAVVTANLTGAVLGKYARELRTLVSPGGALIVSGFSPAELPPILAAFGSAAASHRIDGDWAAASVRL